MTRVQMMEDIIENELTGFEQIVARATCRRRSQRTPVPSPPSTARA